ncbi:MAG: AAA family ATPase [Bacteroidetes bacterium]|nr:AAA family ATPase [Bacteroidota bacterium]
MSFKLLAIRPGKNCHKDFLKNLIPGKLYQFHYEYDFTFQNDTITKITYNYKRQIDLYKQINSHGKSPSITINAIVGKNGAGKSTLLEFIYLIAFSIASNGNIIYPNKRSLTQKINTAHDARERNYFVNELKKLNDFIKRLEVELIYEINDTYYSIYINNGVPEHKLINSTNDKPTNEKRDFKLRKLLGFDDFDFSHFFYTIAINYSIYGLNSKHLGSWVNALFHKNDGYQTPLVINPFRNEGNIDINVENHLAQSRLLANLVNDSMVTKNLLENKPVREMKFEIILDSLQEVNSINLDNVIDKLSKQQSSTLEQIFGKIYSRILGTDYTDEGNNIKHFDLIAKYCIKKLFKIASQYSEYNKFYSLPAKNIPIPELVDFDDFLSALKRDSSHITLKLRQILNTVRFNLLKEKSDSNINWDGYSITIPIEELTIRVNEAIRSTANVDIIELMPTALFVPSIYVGYNDGDISTVNTLSSGELQLVHSIQSLTYHLVNINSVFKANNPDKITYRNILIVLDEIELYFHPEFQRSFIYELIKAINNITIEEIHNINILFSTHSPFILSDIPANATLRLDNGNILSQPKNNTFAANIHDMLADDFYLRDGVIGRWAQKKINSLIPYLKSKLHNKETTMNNNEWDQRTSKEFIDIIGEPLIQNSLLDLYFRAFYENESEKIDQEIRRLQNLKGKQ